MRSRYWIATKHSFEELASHKKEILVIKRTKYWDLRQFRERPFGSYDKADDRNLDIKSLATFTKLKHCKCCNSIRSNKRLAKPKDSSRMIIRHVNPGASELNNQNSR